MAAPERQAGDKRLFHPEPVEARHFFRNIRMRKNIRIREHLPQRGEHFLSAAHIRKPVVQQRGFHAVITYHARGWALK